MRTMSVVTNNMSIYKVGHYSDFNQDIQDRATLVEWTLKLLTELGSLEGALRSLHTIDVV